jgi:predicted short-subunit dehydrogenase-like oxidoreductase (DUF2520 family)
VDSRHVVAGVIAVLIVGAVVGGILFSTRQNRVELTGSVLRVRSHAVDNENTIVLADIRVSNPSTQQFVVKEVQVLLEEHQGSPIPGDTFSETDAQRLFTYYPVLGKKYNPNLMIRQKINPGETMDRMISVRFSGSEDRVQKRKGLRIVVTDADGAKTEIVEKL